MGKRKQAELVEQATLDLILISVNCKLQALLIKNNYLVG
jgi:hypothetical protein